MRKIKSKIKNQKSKIIGKNPDLEKIVMEKIEKGEVRMKPKWLFVVGSVLASAGVVGLTIGAIFLVNLTIFLIRKNGLGYGKLSIMLESFPMWVPVTAIGAITIGIILLRKYDFSYKKNFKLIVITFIMTVVIAGFVIDFLGINLSWSQRGPMRGLYRQIEGGSYLKCNQTKCNFNNYPNGRR